MTQRTISLTEQAYKLLKKQKKRKESYSDLIIRLCNVHDQQQEEDFLIKYIGAFESESERWKEIENKIQRHRENHLTTDSSVVKASSNFICKS
jgi:predicted CopG family antitoxin